jgi:hypothetical protein
MSTNTDEKESRDDEEIKKQLEMCAHCMPAGGCLIRNEMCWYNNDEQKTCSDYQAGGVIQEDKKKA